MSEGMSELQRLICPHSQVTPEDGTGRSICVRCGAAVVTRLTREIFDAQMKAVLRGEK